MQPATTTYRSYMCDWALDNRKSATATDVVGAQLGLYFRQHKDEFLRHLASAEYDMDRMMVDLATGLNGAFAAVAPKLPPGRKEFQEKEMAESVNAIMKRGSEISARQSEIVVRLVAIEMEQASLKEQKQSVNNLQGAAREGRNIQAELVELSKKLAELKVEEGSLKGEQKALRGEQKTLDGRRRALENTATEKDDEVVIDLSFKGHDLNSLFRSVAKAICSVDDYVVPPMDGKERRKFCPQKKMDLKTALFTLLFNTRPQTASKNVAALMGWAAAFMQYVKHDVRVPNSPSMLTFVSRWDDGEAKGHCGKSTLVRSLMGLLRSRGLRVQSDVEPLTFPTEKKVCKGMSGRTLLFFDDIGDGEAGGKLDYEAMNRFLDGINLMTEMKYEAQKPVFAHGYAIGTTNHDSTYGNKYRYPRVEFTPNNATSVTSSKFFQSHAQCRIDRSLNVFDFQDAWETILSYADDDIGKWLNLYAESVNDRTAQFTAVHKVARSLMLSWTRPRATIKELLHRFHEEKVFGKELKYSVKSNTLLSALRDLGLEPENPECDDPFQVAFAKPESLPSPTFDYSHAMEEVWQWIDANVQEPSAKEVC